MPPIMYDCFLCRGSFQFGPHLYRGQPITPWGIMVCLTCFDGNHDGIVPATYPHLIAHLRDKGITPTIQRPRLDSLA
jgi:hypothetical protein